MTLFPSASSLIAKRLHGIQFTIIATVVVSLHPSARAGDHQTAVHLSATPFAGQAAQPTNVAPTAATAPASPEAPQRTVAEEAAILHKGRLRAQQHALARLGANPDPQADEVLLQQLVRQAAGDLPPGLWLDLAEAAAQRKDPRIQKFLSERAKKEPATADPLAPFRDCLHGGNGEAGRAIFTQKPEAGCIRCHSIDGEGGQIGPDLTWLRHTVERLHLLESLIRPDATIAPGFTHLLVKLRNGEQVAGIVNADTDIDLTLTSAVDGTKRKIPHAEIQERTALPSPMPPFFGTVLTKREIRDLIEFLAEGD